MQRLGWWLVGRQGREGEVFVCRENLHPSTISSGLLTVGGHHQGRTTQSCGVEENKASLQMDVIVSSFLCNCSQSNKDTGAVLLRCLCWALYCIAINGGHLSLYTRFLSAIPLIEIVQNKILCWLEVFTRYIDWNGCNCSAEINSDCINNFTFIHNRISDDSNENC